MARTPQSAHFGEFKTPKKRKKAAHHQILLSVIRKRSFLNLWPAWEAPATSSATKARVVRPIIRMSYCGGRWQLMKAEMASACSGAAIPDATLFSRSVTPATADSGIAAKSAGSEGGSSNCGRQAAVTKPQKQARLLIDADSERTAAATAKPA